MKSSLSSQVSTEFAARTGFGRVALVTYSFNKTAQPVQFLEANVAAQTLELFLTERSRTATRPLGHLLVTMTKPESPMDLGDQIFVVVEVATHSGGLPCAYPRLVAVCQGKSHSLEVFADTLCSIGRMRYYHRDDSGSPIIWTSWPSRQLVAA